MLCQNCGRNEATTHIKRVINGATSESHLCAECAGNLGYGDMFSGFGFNLGDLFGGFLGETPMLAQSTARCQKCGSSWSDIVREGRLGCADCYRTFFDKLQPTLQRIHGRIKHNGKISSGGEALRQEADENTPEEKQENEIDKLKKELDESVEAQNYEQAAVIRDKIREMESGK